MDNAPDGQSSASALRNPKHRHISRSAAKRESVQMLGSIKDLQAHFARAGFVEHRPGAGVGVKGSGLNTLDEGSGLETENRPPMARDERRKDHKTWKEVDLPKVDPMAARREARAIVGSMRTTWGLQLPASTSGSSSMVSSPTAYFHPDTARDDTRSALVNTARSIRTIRTLALATAHIARPTDRRVSSSSQLLPRASSRLRPGFSTPSRPSGMPRAVSLGVPSRVSSLGVLEEGPQEDMQADLRKAAIEVLACLRALEERMRLDHDYTGYGQGSTDRTESPIESTGSASTTLNTDTDTTSIRPSSGANDYHDYEDDEEEYNLNALALAEFENQQHTQTWEERIVADGREYKEMDTSDASQEWLNHLKDSVTRWINVVERIFRMPRDGATELESWAQPEMWQGRSRERLQTFLTSHLPLHLQLTMPSTADSSFASSLLPKLSDGFALIHAFNSVVHGSRKPWGFVPAEDIHDTITTGPGAASDGEGSKEWTFRRTGNLTCWAAALKHRYNLPISMPTSTASTLLPKPSTLPSRAAGPSPDFSANQASSPASSTSSKPSRDAQRIDFDPTLVARKGENWEGMFENLLMRWLDEAAAEARDQVSPVIV